MYENFFNLQSKPFELVPDPQFLYPSKSHKKAMMYLDYGIRERIGFILLTGEIGSGKTTILRNLIKGLNDTVTLSKVFNTKVNSEQLIALINEDFGLPVSGKDRITLLRELNDFLVGQYAKGNQSILIIDEAQNLSLKLLEEVRLLSNLETDKQKLLQIILVGQPELRSTLSRPELMQLKQRISISCHIKPLDIMEMEQYIFHRLEKAGRRDAVTFQDGTIQAIYSYSRGIPRLINIICDFLMLSAFVENKHELDQELVRDVIGELDAENRQWEAAESSVQPEHTVNRKPDVLQQRIDTIEQALAQNSLVLEKVSDLVTKLVEQKTSSAVMVPGHPTGDMAGLPGMASLLDMHDESVKPFDKNDAEPANQKRRGLWNWMTG